MGSERPPGLPDEMFRFSLLGREATLLAPRAGRLTCPGRKTIETPHYLPITSRGALPHTTHDVMREHMLVSGLYLGLEDFIEKGGQGGVPPVYNTPTRSSESALRNFLSCPDDILLVMGPRRVPPVAGTPNKPNSITVQTSVGFRQLEPGQYTEAVEKLQPDVAVGIADLVLDQRPGTKRREKMVDRTHAWTRDVLENLYNSAADSQPPTRARYLAPLLPLAEEEQHLYVQDLEDELREHVSGFALYDSSSLAVVPESMADIVRFSFALPRTPQEILREVALGVDITAIPFISEATDAGFALNFEFSGPPPDNGSLAETPLALDMWSATHSTDLSPLVPNCQCYACQKHHRAYIRHLLNAKEMLAWTLLQLHNNHVVSNFFAAIRQSISNGSFNQDRETFERTYQIEFPEQTGQGPRLRGYQFKTKYNDRRKNSPAHGRLDDALDKFTSSQSSVVTPDAEAQELQERGFAEKTG